MKKQFVGGILVEDNKLLLVKRSANDPYMGGLWALPGGAIEVAESATKALIREFNEETNLNITILQKLFVFHRASTEVIIFQVSANKGFLKSNDNDIEQLGFFDFNKFPEKIAIDSLLYILYYQIVQSKLTDHISIVIDKVFASIFYSYISPQFHSYCFVNEAVIYKYIIESTPYRKFKSVVPFLLAKCNPDKIHLFIIPELYYAIWTLLDDCHDKKEYRYGIETALKKFGIEITVIALIKATHNIKILLQDKISISNIEKINRSIIQSATILYQRNSNRIEMNIEDYLAQSKDRTEFLRTSWKAVLKRSGYSKKKIKLIYNFQKQSSEIGQLINDYFDIYKGGLEDFSTKTVCMHSLLLYKEVNELDKSLLNTLWFNKGSNKENYKLLLTKYDIRTLLHQIINEKLDKIIEQIQDSDFDPDEKCILIAWHQMSFIHFKCEVNDTKTLSKFLDAVNNILYQY